MSLVRLANAHLASSRRAATLEDDKDLQARVDVTAAEAQDQPARRQAAPDSPKPDTPAQFNSRVSSALEMLARYIPTEIIALYLAAMSIAPAFENVLSVSAEMIYWIGVIATPLVLLLVFLSNARKGRQPLPPVSQWPVWKALAATVAFGFWGLAVPGNWWVGTDEQRAAIAGFVALLGSFILSIIGDIIDPEPA